MSLQRTAPRHERAWRKSACREVMLLQTCRCAPRSEQARAPCAKEVKGVSHSASGAAAMSVYDKSMRCCGDKGRTRRARTLAQKEQAVMRGQQARQYDIMLYGKRGRGSAVREWRRERVARRHASFMRCVATHARREGICQMRKAKDGRQRVVIGRTGTRDLPVNNYLLRYTPLWEKISLYHYDTYFHNLIHP